MTNLLAILSILFTFNFIGCNTIIYKNIGDIEKVKLEEKNQDEDKHEYYFYSYDGENKVTYRYLSDNSYVDMAKIEVLLNDEVIDERETIYFGNEKFLPSEIWLDNNTVLIFGEYILNIKTLEKNCIDFNEILDDMSKKSFLTYSISPDRKNIAYLSSLDYSIKLYNYNIVEDKWKLLKETAFEYLDTSSEVYKVYWVNNDQIFYDTHYKKIFCYNYSKNINYLYKEGCKLDFISKDLKYLYIYDADSEENNFINLY